MAPLSTPDKRFRVLVAEDDEATRYALSKVLAPLGEIDCVPHGEAALEVAQREVPDLVIADWHMPRVDGLTLLQRLRDSPRTREVPVVLMSGVADPRERLEGLRSGAVDFLVKPVSQDEMLARIRGLLERLARTRERIAEEAEQRARWREEQQRTEGALRDALRLKDEFLGVVSHELRTPLNAILSWSYLLEAQGPESPSFERAVQSIRRNAEAQRRLVEELLDVSRLTTGNLRLELQKAPLATLAREALENVRPAADARGLAIEADLDDAVTVLAEAQRVRTVAWHLLSNAVKFTPRGGRVRVAVRADGDWAELRVSDDGIGIAHEFLPHVFDRFRQADASSTRSYGGLGLGLTLVRGLVEAHGGEVVAESAGSGRGATFTVRLPLAARDAAPAPVAVRSAPHAPRLSGVRVLVVDDHEDSRESVAELLRSEGAEVAQAEDAKEAIAWVGANVADVLLVDLAMPGGDGISLLGAIRRLAPERAGVPAIALTAFVDAADRRATRQAGFEAHLAKPVDPEELVAKIAGLARRH